MKQLVFLVAILFPLKSIYASHIFHLEDKKGQCQWKLYNVKTTKDKVYYKTPQCPKQIVWLKDKSFYYSIKSQIYWANQWTKKPIKIVNFKSARKGHSQGSEVIWGVKGKYNSIYALVIDPQLKQMKVNGKESYEYKSRKISGDTFRGVATEQKATGIVKRWLKGKRQWKSVKYKIVGRHNHNGFDEDLYNNSVLSSKQIIGYNECSENNCENFPSDSSWDVKGWRKKLKLVDNGIESMGYLALDENKGLLFKKSLDDTLHPVKPFLLCEDDCSQTSEIELPKSFSDNFAMVKKGKHLLLFNENRGSIGNLYSFNSPKPIKTFRGPMVFWHPF